MIWVWIGLALSATLLLLKNKKIKAHNLVWAFLPIDCYGISIGGMMVKPFMIFSVLVIGYAILVGKFKLRLTFPMLVSSALLAISIIFSFIFRGNYNIVADITIFSMFFILTVLAICLFSLLESREDLKQIKDVMIATAVGYGIVFILLYVLYKAGIELPAIISPDRSEPSVFLAGRTMLNGKLQESVRLRGFFIDPNSSNMVFIIGLACLFGDWIKKGNHVKNTLYMLVIVGSIILTNSRTALIICIFIAFLSFFRYIFSTVNSTGKITFIGLCLIILLAASIFIIYNDKVFSYIYDNILSGYNNRSGLYDEYGRFNIWKEWLSLLNKDNWLCGVGYYQVSELIGLNKDAHNTIIQILCSSGCIVGIIYMIFFANPLLFTVKRRLYDNRNKYYLTNFIIAYPSILLLLITTSNVASSYLIFFAAFLYVVPEILEQQEPSGYVS